MKKRIKKRNLFKLLFIIPIIALVIFLIRSDFFNIKYIDVKLDKIACAEANQIKDSSGLLGQNIIFLDSKKAKENIKNKFICVRDTTLSRHFLNKISLAVSGRTPVAILRLAEASSSSSIEEIATPSAKPGMDAFLVDDEGVIFSKDGQGSLPNIFFTDQTISLGEKLENINSLKIIDRVKMLAVEPQNAVVADNILIIFSSPKVVFRLDEKIDIKLASLQLILQTAKIDDKRLEFVDLRFDKPIVKFASKKNG